VAHAIYGGEQPMCNFHSQSVLQAGITAMHLGRIHLESGWLSVLVAFQCVLLWFRLYYFSRCATR
jgi:hypothetical protein